MNSIISRFFDNAAPERGGLNMYGIRLLFPVSVVFFSLFLLALSDPSFAATHYVPDDFGTIQAALDGATTGDEIIVRDGTWTGADNKNLDFGGKALALQSENGPESCTIDCQNDGRGFDFQNHETVDSIVDGFTIVNGSVSGNPGWLDDSGGGIWCHSGSPTIRNCIIEGNYAEAFGGGVFAYVGASPVIENCIIVDNYAEQHGGGVRSQGVITVTGCEVTGNTADKGAGISLGVTPVTGNEPVIINCLVTGNTATNLAGGIEVQGAEEGPLTATVSNCTVAGNAAGTRSGGLEVDTGASLAVIDCIFWENSAPLGAQIAVMGNYHPAWLDISYCDVAGGEDGVHVAATSTLSWGAGNIDSHPLFLTGPMGDYYLSQIAAGQGSDSPCVDAGSETAANAGLDSAWTRTDHVGDSGIINMGYHYYEQGQEVPFEVALVTGPGPGLDNPPMVRVFPPDPGASPIYEFPAYGATSYGVNVNCGNLSGDEYDEIVTGAGPGEVYGAHVRGFEVNGTPLPGFSFLAYGTQKFGVNIATGDIDGDGYDEVITGAGPGAVFGPHVRAFRYDYDASTVTAVPEVSYFAYGTQKYGVNVTAGDIDGDGYDEIVTGAGPGLVYGPHVRGWNVDGGAVSAISGVSYLAHGTPRFGVKVSCGDIDGDGMAEIVTGAGPGPDLLAHVRGWNYDGAALVPIDAIDFIAWPLEEAGYGANICALADLGDDGRAEIVVGQGPDPTASTLVNVYRFDNGELVEWFDIEAFDGLTHGATVAAGRF